MKQKLKSHYLMIIARRVRVVGPLMIFLFVFGQSVMAQNHSVSGTVTNASGEPLRGVTIAVKGTFEGTVTDANGEYALAGVSDNATLVFSFVGMKTKEVVVANQAQINIVLEVSTIDMDEVVTIGYGTMKKRDLTGSVSSVKGNIVNAFPTTTLAQSLQGRIAGVHIVQNDGRPGSAMQIRIRGTNSIKGDNSPLWVIDGFPGNPNLINASDVESIEVLKDASATAIYGSRGANGVILVTTRRGRAGDTKVEYEGSYSSQSLIRKLPLMNASEYMQLTNIQQLNDKGAEYFSQDQIKNAGEGTNWQNLMYSSAPINDHSLSVSGGNTKTQFSVNGSYYNQKGILLDNEGYRRISLRTNITHDISKIFNLSLNAILSRIDTDTKGSSGIYGTLSYILMAPPTLKPYNEDGSYTDSRTLYPFIFDAQLNQLMVAKELSNKQKSNNVMANMALAIKPFDGLSIKISGNVSNSDSRSDTYQTLKYIGSAGDASVSTNQGLTLNSDNIITYTTKINENHDLSVMGAFTYEENTFTNTGASGYGFVTDNYETNNLSAATNYRTPSSGYSKWTILSYLGRLNYSYKNRYLATANFRADGSSRYSTGNKWGYFRSGALAWRISEEDFMKNIGTISSLKLRVGYGETGSTAISPYATLSTLSPQQAAFNDDTYTGFAPSSTYPGDLKWETTAQTNFGVDLGLLNNRLYLTAEYYIKNTRDLLNDVRLPVSSGYTSTIKNIGKIQNKGFEVQLDAIALEKAIKWDISANFSINRNKVIKLYNGQEIFGPSIGNGGNVNIIREGKSIGLFYGYVEDGYDENGVVKYKDLEPDGVINDLDRTVIGNSVPDFTYGLNSVLTYKDFEFSFYIQGSQGNDIYSQSMYFQNYYYGYGINMFDEVLYDHWTPQHTNAKYPKIMSSNFTFQKLSDRFVYDGSYVRLKNIQLAYNIPFRRLGVQWIGRGQAYVSAQNLFTIASYPWYDPDVNTYGGGASLSQGIDNYSYPATKSITFGVKLTF